jgi:2-oxoacid:acceptor oxidoreductase delta subunit (pyruvate/2-ketoisovalerate family)
MIKSSIYLPPVSFRPTKNNKTGGWRSQKPIFEEKESSCQSACPAKEDIRKWLDFLKKGKTREAWETILETNPLPAVMGRICPHPCEKECNRADFDQPLAINCLEGFLGETALKNNWKAIQRIDFNGPKIAILGSGPAGLSAAYHLSRKGHRIVIFEAEATLGGMLALGIPEHRLPRDILIREILNNILTSVRYRLCSRIGKDISFEQLKKEFSAVFIATGAQKSKKLEIPGQDNPGVISGLDFLKSVNLGRKTVVGKKIIVIGGGNTAIDAARCAKALGNHVLLIYRKTKKEMKAFPEEITAAEKEGIQFRFQKTPLQINYLEPGLQAIFYNQEEKIYSIFECDVLIPAIGQKTDFSFLPAEIKELAEAGKEEQLEKQGIFLGGDIRSPSWAVNAVADGKLAADRIQSYLSGQKPEKKTKIVKSLTPNLDYFQREKRKEVIDSSNLAAKEAERCFSCGRCNNCGICWLFCPDNAVRFEGGEYSFNYDYCKGCGICQNECPRKVISLIGEEK